MDANIQAFQVLLKALFIPPTIDWHLQSEKAFIMHLDKQVQPFLKWIWGRTKAPTNRMNRLISINLLDPTIQTYQELLKAQLIFSTRALHLQLVRDTTLHLDQLY